MNEKLLEAIYDDNFITKLVVMDETDSTNSEAARQARAGALSGSLFVAEAQTGGKGRLGRSWSSPAGTGVWMSLLLKPDINIANAPMLTLVTALATVHAINDITDLSSGLNVVNRQDTPSNSDATNSNVVSSPHPVDVKIKWPNDIVINNKKVCGILTEMVSCGSDNSVIIGMGINVNTESFPDGIKDVATSLCIESGRKLCREELIVSLMRYFHRYYDIFIKTEDLSALTDEYNSLLINRDKPVILSSENIDFPDNPYTAIGINKDGALIVLDKTNKFHEITSGEVSVRGIYGYGV